MFLTSRIWERKSFLIRALFMLSNILAGNSTNFDTVNPLRTGSSREPFPLMIIAPSGIANEIMQTVSSAGVRIGEIGYVDDSGSAKLVDDGQEDELTPLFRESAYTKIKKIVGDTEPDNFELMKDKVEKAALDAINKKANVVKNIKRKGKL